MPRSASQSFRRNPPRACLAACLLLFAAIAPASAQTLPAPSDLSGIAVSTNSATWTWGAVTGASYYDVYLATGAATPALWEYVSATTFTITSLTPNVYASVYIEAVSSGGEMGAPTPTVSLYTLAAPPTGLVATSVYESSMTLQWGSGGNAPGTTYQLQYGAPSVGVSTLDLTALTTTLTDLSPDTSYFVLLNAINGAGAVESQAAFINAVQTLPVPPASAPTGLAGTGVGYSSASWTWNAFPGASAYEVYLSTGASSYFAATTTGTGYTAGGLPPGRAVTAYVAAEDAGGAGPLSQGAAAYTWAAPPSMLTLYLVGQSSAAVSWCADGNPADTTYEASIYPAGGSVTTLETTLLQATFTALAPFTTYYVTVDALNPLNVATASTTTLTFQTVPSALTSAPTGFNGASDSTSTITWTWDPVASAILYQVYLNGSPRSTVYPPSTSFTLGGLTPDQAETLSVQAANAVGAGPVSQGVAVYTLAAPPTALAAYTLGSSSIAVRWDADGNPGAVIYDILLSSSADLAQPTLFQAQGSSAAISGLASDARYFMTVEALNGSGIVAPSGVVVATATASPPSAGTVVYSSAAAVLALNTTQGSAVLDLPAGSFTQTVTVTLALPTAFPSAPSAAQLTGTGVGVAVTVTDGQEPQRPGSLALSYSGASLGDLDPSQFVIARFDPVDNVWVPLPSTPDPEDQRVVAETDHLSLFQIMAAAPADSLSAPKVFPNPLRPSLGETVVTFANLPANADLKIFDLLGEKVRELQADASGMATWDGRNSSGEGVATGVYFVMVGSGSARRTLKVGVVR